MVKKPAVPPPLALRAMGRLLVRSLRPFCYTVEQARSTVDDTGHRLVPAEWAMRIILRVVTIVAILIVVALIGLIVAHEIIEGRVFRELENQPGMQVSVGRRVGTLIYGYKLIDIMVRYTGAENEGLPATLEIPRLNVRWHLRPLELTGVDWGESELVLGPTSEEPEEIRIGAGALHQDEPGWLASDAIPLGPDGWRGSGTLVVRTDGKEMSATVRIERLPGRLVEVVGGGPEGFEVPEYVVLEMELRGGPTRLQASGSISDPVTRRSFRF
jgi:hypothetical protein